MIDALMILHENAATEVTVLESSVAKKEQSLRGIVADMQITTEVMGVNCSSVLTTWQQSTRAMQELGESINRVAAKAGYICDFNAAITNTADCACWGPAGGDQRQAGAGGGG